MGRINVYLDDTRECPEGYMLARTYGECIRLLNEFDIDILSLDHDLGTRPSGYDVAKWIVTTGHWPRRVRLHSANPVGRDNMRQLLLRHAPSHVIVDG